MDIEQKEKDDYPVMLSICVPTYNHEKYIRECLESVFMQKTKYSYEILVGEDKSTDNTRSILKEIEKEGHYGLKVFYREKNMNNSSYKNVTDLMDRSRGKYLIFLEGDDFWIDSNKIECQLNFLEQNPDYIAVSHNCIIVDAESCKTEEKYPECLDEEYTFDHFASEIMPGQLTTVMMRNVCNNTKINTSIVRSDTSPGDRKSYFMLLCYGKIHCIQKRMSAYRHIVCGGDSWSATHKYDYSETKKWYIELRDYAEKNGFQKAYIIADYMLLASIRQALLVYHKIDLLQLLTELNSVDNLLKSSLYLINRDFNRYILKKKVFVRFSE